MSDAENAKARHPQVFLSYAQEDRDIAIRIANTLRNAGLRLSNQKRIRELIDVTLFFLIATSTRPIIGDICNKELSARMILFEFKNTT